MHDVLNAVLGLLNLDQAGASDHIINDLLALVNCLDSLCELMVSGLPLLLLLLALPGGNVHCLLGVVDELVRIDDVLLEELLLGDERVVELMVADSNADLRLALPLLDSVLDGIVISQSNSVIILFGLDLEAQVIIHVLKRCDEFIQWSTGR